MSIHVVLVHPEIHWNTGNAGRTCLATGATLHLIEPPGFSLDEAQVKRAGSTIGSTRMCACGQTGRRSSTSCQRWVSRIFSHGLPSALHARHADRFVGMPMMSERMRSLNLSTTVAIAVYDVLRQLRVGQAG